MPIVQIMRVGRHVAANRMEIEYTDSDLDMAAAAYSPERKRAVLTLGHPKDNRPDLGTVNSLSAVNGKLFAHFTSVADRALDWVRAGLYKYVSASFCSPLSPDNPTPGAWYLRHVGMLGAMPPAVKGMAPLEFAAPASGYLEFAEDDFSVGGPGSLGVLVGSIDGFQIPPGYRVESEAESFSVSIAETKPTGGRGKVSGMPTHRGGGARDRRRGVPSKATLVLFCHVSSFQAVVTV